MSNQLIQKRDELEQQSASAIKELKMKEKVSYGFGGVALNLLYGTAGGFIMYFYTEIAGIAVAVVGVFLMIARLLDGVSDIVMGFVVDKTKSKHGRARPWLLWLAVPFGLSVALLFTSPEFGTNGKIIYAFLTYVFATVIIYTAVGVPHATMISTLTQNQLQRGHLAVSKTVFNSMSGILIGIVTLPIIAMYGGGKQGWFLMAVTYGVVSILILLIVFKNTKERSTEVRTKVENETTVPLMESLKALMKNKYWLIIIGIALLVSFMSGLNASIIYYAEYILGNTELVGIMNAASGLPMILSLILVVPLMKKMTKRNLAITGFAMTTLGAAVMLINPESLTIVLVGRVISGLALPLVVAPVSAMIADTVEYGEWKTGVRNEGTLFAAESMGMKVGLGLGGMVLGWVMAWAGYVGGQATQSPEVLSAIKFANIHMVIIIAIVAIVLLSFYKLDKEYPKILEELNARKNS